MPPASRFRLPGYEESFGNDSDSYLFYEQTKKTPMKTRKLVLVTLVPLVLATFQTAAYADFSDGVHRFKDDVKEAGLQIGHGARAAAHATADVSKKVGHAVANTARHGYHATKDAIHHVGHESKSGT
jgi:hypothetical protein